jgi:hypothetical protein
MRLHELWCSEKAAHENVIITIYLPSRLSRAKAAIDAHIHVFESVVFRFSCTISKRQFFCVNNFFVFFIGPGGERAR